MAGRGAEGERDEKGGERGEGGKGKEMGRGWGSARKWGESGEGKEMGRARGGESKTREYTIVGYSQFIISILRFQFIDTIKHHSPVSSIFQDAIIELIRKSKLASGLPIVTDSQSSDL